LRRLGIIVPEIFRHHRARSALSISDWHGTIKVSAIIPVFNGSASLRQAIDSVLDQNSPGLELIVVDDGSTERPPAAR
jgi:cellulose synthase/poly-beta-1,6-N-acetylglucosamine synthase-like glycosyltransferase